MNHFQVFQGDADTACSKFFWCVFSRIRTKYGPEKLRILRTLRTLFTQWELVRGIALIRRNTVLLNLKRTRLYLECTSGSNFSNLKLNCLILWVLIIVFDQNSIPFITRWNSVKTFQRHYYRCIIFSVAYDEKVESNMKLIQRFCIEIQEGV